MASQRLDRSELRRRLAAEAPAWVVDELADMFEPAFLTFRRQAEAPAKKRNPKPETAPRRARIGRLAEASDEGDA